MENPIRNLKGWPRGRRLLAPDRLARRAPRLYLFMAALFMLPGHAITLGFPLVALALLIGLPDAVLSAQSLADWARVLLHLGVLVGTAAMSAFLWRQRMPLPPGHPLEGGERLPLDSVIESLQSESRLARPHAVRITDRHQLTTTCVPGNGFALFNRQVLLFGLPTLMALTSKLTESALRRILSAPNTFKGRVLRSIACHDDCWQQYRAIYRDQGTIPARIMALLFGAYAPAYRRLCTPALRWNELERDTVLNQQICVEDVLELVAADTMVGRYLDTMFWPAVHDTATHEPEPPRPHAMLGPMMREQLPPEAVNRLLAEAMHEPESDHAAVPTVGERLANLGCRQFGAMDLVGEPVAATLLPNTLGSVIGQFDDVWRRGVRREWRQVHAKHTKNRARLTALRRRAMSHRIRGQEAMTYAKLAKHYLAPDEAATVYRQIAKMNPEDPKLLLGVGRLLLSQGSEYGIRLVKHVARLDPRLTAKARKVLMHYPVSVREGRRFGAQPGKAA